MSLHHGKCSYLKEQAILGEFPFVQLKAWRLCRASIYGAGHSAFSLKSWRPKQVLQRLSLLGFAGIMISARLGAPQATVLPYTVFEGWIGCSGTIPQTPEFRIFLRFASFLSSAESWTLPSPLLGLASCSHVFWSHVIVHEVIVPHACTVHNGKICVVQRKFSDEDILDLPTTPWGESSLELVITLWGKGSKDRA